jgi:hypothetical protein
MYKYRQNELNVDENMLARYMYEIQNQNKD